MLVDVIVSRAASRVDHVDMHRSAQFRCGWMRFWRRANGWAGWASAR